MSTDDGMVLDSFTTCDYCQPGFGRLAAGRGWPGSNEVGALYAADPRIILTDNLLTKLRAGGFPGIEVAGEVITVSAPGRWVVYRITGNWRDTGGWVAEWPDEPDGRVLGASLNAVAPAGQPLHSLECDGPGCTYEACICWCHAEVDPWPSPTFRA